MTHDCLTCFYLCVHIYIYIFVYHLHIWLPPLLPKPENPPGSTSRESLKVACIPFAGGCWFPIVAQAFLVSGKTLHLVTCNLFILSIKYFVHRHNYTRYCCLIKDILKICKVDSHTSCKMQFYNQRGNQWSKGSDPNILCFNEKSHFWIHRDWNHSIGHQFGDDCHNEWLPSLWLGIMWRSESKTKTTPIRNESTNCNWLQ